MLSSRPHTLSSSLAFTSGFLPSYYYFVAHVVLFHGMHFSSSKTMGMPLSRTKQLTQFT